MIASINDKVFMVRDLCFKWVAGLFLFKAAGESAEISIVKPASMNSNLIYFNTIFGGKK